MKAMILAAGRGERLRPQTDTTPKPLLSAGGRPLIDYHIEALAAADITEIVINLAWLGKKISDYLGNGSQFGVSISYSDEGERRLDTGGGIMHALPMLGSDPFVVVNGDIWCDLDYRTLPAAPTTLAHLVMVDNPPQHPHGDFVLTDGHLSDSSDRRLTYSGIGVYRPELFDDCHEGVFPLAPVLRAHFTRRQISAQHFQGQWTDAGTPQRLQTLDETLTQTR